MRNKRKKDPIAVTLGRRGGIARFKALTSKRRKEIALKANQARWSRIKGGTIMKTFLIVLLSLALGGCNAVSKLTDGPKPHDPGLYTGPYDQTFVYNVNSNDYQKSETLAFPQKSVEVTYHDINQPAHTAVNMPVYDQVQVGVLSAYAIVFVSGDKMLVTIKNANNTLTSVMSHAS